MPKFECRICGKELLRDEVRAECSYCGESEGAHYICPSGHYVCERCRKASAADLVIATCAGTRLKDPVEIANLLMSHTSFPEYGMEHHLIVAAAMLAALRNNGRAGISKRDVETAVRRMAAVPDRACGEFGGCGACLSVGCLVSILLKATPVSDRERSDSLRASARALERVAELGGPRCCKQSVYASIEAACGILSAHSDVNLREGQIRCAFARRTSHCKGERCPYHG